MRSLKLVTATALLFTPSLGLAQDGSAMVGVKQKAWMVSNFRSFDCALSGSPASLSGTGTVSFDSSGDGGIEIAVSTGPDGAPVVSAHAINTKGTGANNGRGMNNTCVIRAADGADQPKGATCDLSGDASAPTVRFTVPLSAFGDGSTAKNYVGHVTLIKQRTVSPLIHMWQSKKGYDYYKAQSDMSSAHASTNPLYTPVATCSTNALAEKTPPKGGGKPMTSTYDLVLLKK
ncbi:hypothetical protein [Sphingomonas sp. RB1R13]|uniref:hypothetical protein n=1 Tax=Sphingomonas sp. RB1R13 TaxID=3096159 RepID=UPI002FC6E976